MQLWPSCSWMKNQMEKYQWSNFPNLVTHLPNLVTHLPNLVTHETHLPNLVTHLPNLVTLGSHIIPLHKLINR